MSGVMKCRICSVKSMVILSGLLFITVCAYAQEPVWEWATNAGGTDYDHGNAIAVDSEGNCYVTGNFVEMATFGEHILVSSDEGDLDIYVAKVDINGDWVWAVRAGGIDWDSGNGIVLDDFGNIYVTGYFMMTADFGPYSLTSNGWDDAFVAKLDPDGNWLWVNQAGGTHYDGGSAIAIDEAGCCYASGGFMNTAYFGSLSLTTNAYSEGFMAKLDTSGNWQWAKKTGSSAREIIIDNIGNLNIVGSFDGTVNFGPFSLTSYGCEDIFVAKLDSNGNFLWVNQAGGTSRDFGDGISLDEINNVYITGSFKNDANFGSYSIDSHGNDDIFVSKLDSSGNWEWVIEAGSTDSDGGKGITIDGVNSNVYVTGSFESVANFGSYSLTSSGSDDIFVAKLDNDGNWQWLAGAGGESQDKGSSIALDDENNCYITGYFKETSTFSSQIINSFGNSDIFVAKLNPPVSVDPDIDLELFNLNHYPNPAENNTFISYSLKQATSVSLEIYNLRGQLVETLREDNIQAGDHTIECDCQNIPSGIYFLKMKTDNEESIRKMVLIR